VNIHFVLFCFLFVNKVAFYIENEITRIMSFLFSNITYFLERC